MADLADAIGHAHSQGLIHRDIKPANILIELARPEEHSPGIGKAMIVDFGLALREEVEPVLTIQGQLVGTPAYMSPNRRQAKAIGRTPEVMSIAWESFCTNRFAVSCRFAAPGPCSSIR